MDIDQEEKLIRRSVCFRKRQLDFLKRRALVEKCSVGALIRTIINEFISGEKEI